MNRMPMIVSVGVLLLTGCASHKVGLCYVESPRQERTLLTPTEWFALLAHGVDPKKGTVSRSVIDCSGVPVAWKEPDAHECREAGSDATPLPPPDHLTTEDVVMETLQANLRLVWIITQRYSNGEGLGPIALVERTDDRITVRALGSLRSFPRKAHLRLERSGDAHVLVAEGAQCTDEPVPVCRRFVRILPMRNGRFFAESVTSEDDKCLGPSWFPLKRQVVLDLPGGLQRRVELTSTLEFGSGSVAIDESVAMDDLDPKQPLLQPQPYRRAHSKRELRVEGNRLVATDASLWIRMMEQEVLVGAQLVKEKPASSPASVQATQGEP